MGTTKTSLFTEEQNELALLAKALGHPARIAILQHLLRAKACINSDLVQETGLAQATVSQHLRELKDIGLIKGSIEGSAMNYCIHSENWNTAAQHLAELFNLIDTNSGNNCC